VSLANDPTSPSFQYSLNSSSSSSHSPINNEFSLLDEDSLSYYPLTNDTTQYFPTPIDQMVESGDFDGLWKFDEQQNDQYCDEYTTLGAEESVHLSTFSPCDELSILSS